MDQRLTVISSNNSSEKQITDFLGTCWDMQAALLGAQIYALSTFERLQQSKLRELNACFRRGVLLINRKKRRIAVVKATSDPVLDFSGFVTIKFVPFYLLSNTDNTVSTFHLSILTGKKTYVFYSRVKHQS